MSMGGAPPHIFHILEVRYVCRYVCMYVYSYIYAHTCIDLDCLPYLTCLASVRQHRMHANSRGSYYAYCSFYAVAIKSRGLFVPPLHSNGRSPLLPSTYHRRSHIVVRDPRRPASPLYKSGRKGHVPGLRRGVLAVWTPSGRFR